MNIRFITYCGKSYYKLRQNIDIDRTLTSVILILEGVTCIQIPYTN